MSQVELPPVQAGTFERFVRSTAGASLILALAVFAACLFGIFTRPVGFLATIWPANAIMLGLLLRMPRSASIIGWLAATAAYLAADLLTGSTLFKAVILNGANLVGIGAAYFVFTRLPVGMTRLEQPTSMLYLLLAAAVGSCASGAVGAVANPLLFGGTAFGGWSFWFATELVNYILILPVVLSAFVASPAEDASDFGRPALAQLMPAAALVLSGAAAIIIGGPGAIAFPVPALLWCGLVYPIFQTAVLVLLFGLWTLAGITGGYLFDAGSSANEMTLVSVRLGASLIAFAPIMLASVMQARKDLLTRLQHLATHDQLTGVLNRHAFRERAQDLVSRRGAAAVLMIDLDHFKRVNDQLGHAAGDDVLVAFAQRVRDCLIGTDVFSRHGGEEFALLLPNTTGARAIGIAEAIRRRTAETPIALSDGRLVAVTVSAGVLIVPDTAGACIDRLLSQADEMLYRAKANGRDRIEVATEEEGGAVLAARA